MIINVLFILIATLIASILGSILALYIKKLPKELSIGLQNFSLGAIISLIFLELIHESIESFEEMSDSKVLNVSTPILIILGVSIIFFFSHELLHKLSHHHEHDNNDNEECHDHLHSNELDEENHTLFISSLIFLGAISIHNIPEGLSLGFSFISSSHNGIITAFILFIHNLIISYSMASSFKLSGKKNGFSFLLTTLSSLPALIFALLGLFLTSLNLSSIGSGIILSISSGSLLYVLFIELLPQAFKEYKSKYSFIYILLGILLTGLLIFTIHTH